MSDYDSVWKEMLDHFFPLFVAFVLTVADAEIDWSRDHESLETEMRKLLEEAEVGGRRIDKLVKVFGRAEGDETLLHVEVQVKPEDDFERRMYVYNYRAEDRYNQPVVSLAVLGDDRPDWRPSQYVFEKWGCRKVFEFIPVKLLDWRGREPELEAHANPVAVFVLAHLQGLATRGDEEQRAEWKVRLARNYASRNLVAADLRQWLRYLDWLLDLPVDRNREVWRQIRQFTEEKAMPFVDYFQQREIDSKRDGEIQGLLQGIQRMLKMKFRAEGLSLMPMLEQQTDLDLMRRFLDAIEPASSVEELRQILP